LLQVAGAQAGLDVADGDVPVEGGQGGDETGGGVAMHQHDVGPGLLIGPVELVQQVAGQAVEGLVLGHHLEVLVDPQAEGGEHLLEHLAVLAGGADMQVDLGPVAQHTGQWGHLDRLRAGTEYHHDGVGHGLTPRSIPWTKL
jgi:hypothetical protein